MSEIVIKKMDFPTAIKAASLEGLCFSEPWSADAIAEMACDENSVFLYAEIEGNFAGHAGMKTVLDEGHICNIAVCPEFRRRGVGHALVDALISYANKRGLSVLMLEVRNRNTAAQTLYEKAGFKRVGIRRGYYRNPTDDAILYNLDLRQGQI